MITTRSTTKTFIERQAAAHIAVARLDSWARLRDELAVLGGLYGMSKPEAARWAAQQAAEIRHAVLNAQGRPEASPAAHETRDVRF